ncbi:MAG: NAD-dependent epimerase/dehydratase family protein [Acidobacteria bacterium]|nr:NAD-dependent epimerase/dehydratase family protein [Acidobacteriota bacterium]NIM61476.1 NAD-dependent epimerase/dehydratase family protein [Acidobacteriota bacterium]NIO58108.1 NAD-dependent epimerase/dehydratase family protein [Acidobacteriota bacterium]NIQ29120.1 NAD-dependent epimerase/dehydratase family protein [Acidobacteriota bacterium]NIQ83671.1 NAD-dependent epimerase/dehydratase family protein [Acidobacteriota bacterium]
MSVYVVAGGGGFIGSNIAEHLLGSGEEVRVLDNFATGRRRNLEHADRWAAEGGGTYRLIEGDIRDAEACDEAVAGADYVLLLAAIPSVPRSVADPVTTHDVNVRGTLAVLEAARRHNVERVVYSSSSSLYGESETLPKVESMAPAPISPYGLQKLAAETYCSLYHRLYGTPTVALRYFNVFGPRQDPDSDYAAVIPRFITAVKSGTPPTIYGDGEQTRDFTFVANVIEANLLASRAGEAALGRAFNIGCGTRISLNDLVGTLAELTGRAVEPIHADPRPGDIKHSMAGIDEAQKHLGFEPRVDLVEGLRRTLDAY